MAVHADLRRRVDREVQVRALSISTIVFNSSGSVRHASLPAVCLSACHYFTVSRTTSSIVVTPSFTLRRPLRAQRDHPFVDRLAPQLEPRRADQNQLAQLSVISITS